MKSMKSLALAIAGALAAIGSMASPASADPSMTNAVAGNYNGMPYQVFLPDNYTPGENLPVVLFLHGAGGRGTNNYSQVTGVDPLFATLKSSYRAIVVAPQCPTNATWAAINQGDNWTVGAYHETGGNLPAQTASMTKALAILDQTIATYHPDTTRQYITGLSMGGYGTWEAIARYPNRFAAAAPLSGGGDLDSVQDIKDIPIWAYHGLGDTIVPESGTIDMINALHAVQNPNDPDYAEATLKGGKGHQGWDYFYTDHSGKNLFDWQSYSGSDGNTFFYPWLFSQQLTVPEPASMGVMTLAALGLLRRRRMA